MKTYNLKVGEYNGFADVKAEFPDEITWNRSSVYDNIYNYWTIVDSKKYENLADSDLFGLYSIDLLDKLLLIYREVIGSESLPVKSEDEYLSDIKILRNYVSIVFTKNYKIESMTRIIDMTDPLNSWGNKVISIHFHNLIDEMEHVYIEESNMTNIWKLKPSEQLEATERLFYGDKAERIWSEGMCLALQKLQYRYRPSIVRGSLIIDSGISREDSFDDMIDKLEKLNECLNDI